MAHPWTSRTKHDYKEPPAERRRYREERLAVTLKLTLEDPDQADRDQEEGWETYIPERYKEPKREARPARGWLWNDKGEGYGNQWQWPFNHRYALSRKGYRTGVENAIKNEAFDGHWRQQAELDMVDIRQLLAQQEETYRDIIFQEIEEERELNRK